MTDPPARDPDDMVPVSVRLGAVVPPEDPEDWTRPLTWVAAIGMLVAPAILVGWFLLAAPTDSARALAGTYAVGIALVVGAAAAGGTQLGRARAVVGTLAAGLLGALLLVMVGAVAGEGGGCQIDMKPWVACPPSPTLAHAAAGALAGLAGCLPAALAAGLVAGRVSRLQRAVLASLLGALMTAAVVPNLV